MSDETHKALARELAPGGIEVKSVLGMEICISPNAGDNITLSPLFIDLDVERLRASVGRSR